MFLSVATNKPKFGRKMEPNYCHVSKMTHAPCGVYFEENMFWNWVARTRCVKFIGLDYVMCFINETGRLNVWRKVTLQLLTLIYTNT